MSSQNYFATLNAIDGSKHVEKSCHLGSGPLWRSVAMQNGTDLEPAARAAYAKIPIWQGVDLDAYRGKSREEVRVSTVA